MLTVWVHVPVNLSPLTFKFKRIKVRPLNCPRQLPAKSVRFVATLAELATGTERRGTVIAPPNRSAKHENASLLTVLSNKAVFPSRIVRRIEPGFWAVNLQRWALATLGDCFTF